MYELKPEREDEGKEGEEKCGRNSNGERDRNRDRHESMKNERNEGVCRWQSRQREDR